MYLTGLQVVRGISNKIVTRGHAACLCACVCVFVESVSFSNENMTHAVMSIHRMKRGREEGGGKRVSRMHVWHDVVQPILWNSMTVSGYNNKNSTLKKEEKNPHSRQRDLTVRRLVMGFLMSFHYKTSPVCVGGMRGYESVTQRSREGRRMCVSVFLCDS